MSALGAFLPFLSQMIHSFILLNIAGRDYCSHVPVLLCHYTNNSISKSVAYFITDVLPLYNTLIDKGFLRAIIV